MKRFILDWDKEVVFNFQSDLESGNYDNEKMVYVNIEEYQNVSIFLCKIMLYYNNICIFINFCVDFYVLRKMLVNGVWIIQFSYIKDRRINYK